MTKSAILRLLEQVCWIYTQKGAAARLDVPLDDVSQWLNGTIAVPRGYHFLLKKMLPKKPKHYGNADFTFIDLFAGIGGIRKGFDAQGGECVFTSEWDKHAQRTYAANHYVESKESMMGDITQIDPDEIPDHDVLLAGFPCQPFSIAGVSKKNSLGFDHGFKCKTQGTLFFNVAKILEVKRPMAFLLENVKNLKSHDKGNTFKVIMETLGELGYECITTNVIDGQHFVPQHRERIFIVGFKKGTGFTWDDLVLPEQGPKIKTILEPIEAIDKKYILTQNLWLYLRNYAAKHKAKNNGFGFGMVGPDDVARTLSARYYKDGSEVLVSRGARKRPRRLTPLECSRLMGYAKPGKSNFVIPVSDTQAYKQFGNSVVVPVVDEVARIMKPHIMAGKVLFEKDSKKLRLAS